MNLPILKQAFERLPPAELSQYLCANNTRWRINDNLLGDQRYCPLVRRTETIAAFQERRLDQSTKALIDRFEPELIHGDMGSALPKHGSISYYLQRSWEREELCRA